MPIKGIFTQSKNHDDLEQRIALLEKEIKRINALEVNMKRFLKLEGKLHTISYLPEKNIHQKKESPPVK